MNPHLAPRAPDQPALLALGCMNFGRRTPRAESLRILERALEAGVRLLDTANVYTQGDSERIVGEALRGRRDAALVATKVGADRVGGRPEGLAPDRIRAACDESRSRLGIDVIDLYYLHLPDPLVPAAAQVDAVAGLLEAGKILHWGLSNHASWQILEFALLAKERGIAPPVVAQQLYNPLVRQLDLEYFRFARAHGVHTTVYNPLAGGLLAGGHAGDAPPPKGGRFDRNALYQKRYWRPAMFAAVEALRQVAAGAGLSLVELSYGFVLGHPAVDSVLVGPGTLDHLEAALAARSVVLTDDVRRAVADVYVELVGTDASYAR